MELISTVENYRDQNLTPTNDEPTFRRTIANIIAWRVENRDKARGFQGEGVPITSSEVAEMDPLCRDH